MFIMVFMFLDYYAFPVHLQVFECCSGDCNPVNYVSIGLNLDICAYCNENMDEWSEPVDPYYHYMADNENFQWSYEIASSA